MTSPSDEASEPFPEIALISEKEWRKGIPRRARIHKVIRLLSVWRT
jgi:hypothetical protein